MVFDGIDQPTVTQFTLGYATSLPVTIGRSYRFTVRSVNYCFTSEPATVCFGSFSPPATFAVRVPRAPIAPPRPYRHSSSDIGTSALKDAQIAIRWNAPIDNGGSPITGYKVFVAGPGQSTYTDSSLKTLSDLAITAAATGDRVLQYQYPGTTSEGDVYRSVNVFFILNSQYFLLLLLVQSSYTVLITSSYRTRYI